MGRNDLCFCGSGKKHKRCHDNIKSESIIARLYRFYMTIDNEIEAQKREKKLKFTCKKGCSECCSQYFVISESEFIVIIDYLMRNWEYQKIDDIIRVCKEQWTTIQDQFPLFAQKLEEFIGGKSVDIFLYNYLHTPLKLPFPCVFLDRESKVCMIYKVRPLICRVHGVSVVDIDNDNEVCSKIPSLLSKQNELVDLHHLKEDISSFIFIRKGKKVILRRPYPIFYFINMVFENVSDVNEFTKTQMYKRITLYSENGYIENLIQTYKHIN